VQGQSRFDASNSETNAIHKRPRPGQSLVAELAEAVHKHPTRFQSGDLIIAIQCFRMKTS